MGRLTGARAALLAAVVVAGVIGSGMPRAVANPCTMAAVWNAGDGAWSDPNSWAGHQLPCTGASVSLPLDGVKVTVDVATDIGDLQAKSNMDITQPMDDSGSFNTTGDVNLGASVNVIHSVTIGGVLSAGYISAGDNMTIDTLNVGGFAHLSSPVVQIKHGGTTWQGGMDVVAGSFQLGTGTLLGSETFTIDGAFDLTVDPIGTAALPTSSKIVKTGPGTAQLSGIWSISGNVSVQQGQLNVMASARSLAGSFDAHAGEFDIPTGTELDVYSEQTDTLNVNAAEPRLGAVVGAGTFKLLQGHVSVSGGFDVTGPIAIGGDGARFDASTLPLHFTSLALGGVSPGSGTYAGAALTVDDFTASDAATFRDCVTPGIQLVNGGTLGGSLGALQVDNCTVHNQGTLDWTGAGTIGLANNATLSNEGVLNVDPGLHRVNGNQGNRFVNEGELHFDGTLMTRLADVNAFVQQQGQGLSTRRRSSGRTPCSTRVRRWTAEAPTPCRTAR